MAIRVRVAILSINLTEANLTGSTFLRKGTACTFKRQVIVKMNHFAKKITAFTVAVMLLVSVAAMQVGAAVEYRLNGFTFNLINNTTATITGYDDQTTNVVIPETLLERKIVSIANEAFKNDEIITSVDLSQAVYLEKIGSYSFAGCTAISGELVIPETVTSILYSAFQGCSSISSVAINAKIKNIPQWCFYGCNSIETVSLPDGLEKIERAAFTGCTSLSYVNIPASVDDINDYAFSNTPNLTLGVWYGSYGYEYAKAKNIPYILLDGTLLGDANGDGSVNINDVTTIQRYLAELDTLEGIYLHAADVNQDGTVDIADATAIQMYLAEYEMDYPIGEIMTQ